MCVNGCGPHWLPRWVKPTYFDAECAQHDIDYADGMIKGEADRMFRDRMIHRAGKEKSWIKRAYRKTNAWIFYGLVKSPLSWLSHKRPVG